MCECCKKPAKWNGYTYNRFCSHSCANKVQMKRLHVEKKQIWINAAVKAKRTCLERYGHINYLHCKEGKEKVKATILKKFGVTHQCKSEKIKEQIKKTKLEKYGSSSYFNIEKVKRTCLKRYGADNIRKAECFKQRVKQKCLEKYGNENYNNRGKAKQTCLERYGHAQDFSSKEYKENWTKLYKEKTGYNWPSQNPDVIKKIAQSHKNVAIQRLQTICSDTIINKTKDKITCNCNNCNKNYTISLQLLKFRIAKHETLCTECNKFVFSNFRSTGEQEVFDYVKMLNTNAMHNYRKLLDNARELDVYLPDKKLAIEYDGLYWHNELNKENNYHLLKTNECEAKGIQLIHIFEDEWIHKQEIVKSRLSGLLCKNNKLFARKCKIVSNIDAKTVKDFLETNHIQGYCQSKYRYGLYYNDDLVSVMSFGKSRFAKGEFELLRFCNKLYTNVIGGASRLFKHFLKDHPEIREVTSYADRRWSVGNMYEKIGFVKTEYTDCNYFYVTKSFRQNRMNFQKHKLVAEGFDPNKTEHEIMLERKIFRIYDCGNIVYKFSR